MSSFVNHLVSARCKACVLGVLGAVLVGGLLAAAPQEAAGTTTARGGTQPQVSPGPYPTAYVGDAPGLTGAKFTPLDSQTNTAGPTITFSGVSYQGDGDAAAVSPNGATLYEVVSPVTPPCADGLLVPVSTTTGAIGTPIPVGSIEPSGGAPDPAGVAITPDGRMAYVSSSCGSHVTPVNLTTGKAGKPIPAGSVEGGLAITPDGSTAYVPDCLGNQVTPIDLATGKPGTPIKAGSCPQAVAITPSGTTAYVADDGANTVTPITLASRTAGSPIKVCPAGGGPDAIAITPDGSTAYVTCFWSGTVTAINLATNKAAKPLALPSEATDGAQPEDVAISPAGSPAYVVDWDGDVADPLNTATSKIGTPIGVGVSGGGQPMSAAFTPGWTAQATVPSATSATSPAMTEFDGNLYAAFISGGLVRYAVRTGTHWSATASVSGSWGHAESDVKPALVVYAGSLYAFWTGVSTHKIFYSAFDGTTWSSQATVSGSWGTALTDQGPAVATTVTASVGVAATPTMYVAWTGRTSGSVYYSSFSGASWATQQIAVGGHATSYSPAIAPLPSSRDPLAIAWTTSSGAISYGTLGSSGFNTEGTQPQARTNVGPALLFLGGASAGTLYLAWKGETTDKIFYSAVFDLPNSIAPGDWTAQETLPVALTGEAPALAAYGWDVVAAWHGLSSDSVWFSYAEDPY